MCTFVCVLVYAFVFVLVLHPFIFPHDGGRAQDLCSECKIDKVGFADWMPFQPFTLCGRSSLIKKPS